MIDRNINKKISEEFDVIVIGGGINGTGVARDASERGLKVLLLEKNDFGSGCTSASTRLIHGGLRYLERFEFDLVKESLREREYLLKNASHLVRPVEFYLPVFKHDKRKLWFIRLGMHVYDYLGREKSLPSHKLLSTNEFSKNEPSINADNLVGGISYYDSQVLFPERLCIENILMASNNGAAIFNHAEVSAIKLENNLVKYVEFRDKLTNTIYTAKTKQLVNASGPWLDNLCNLAGKEIKQKLGGTKGSHIIVKPFANGPKHALLLTARSDNRPFFIIPWFEYYLIGTTDIYYKGDLDKVKASNYEVEYLLKETNNVLRTRTITKDDILFSYSGIRPLPYSKDTKPGNVSRKHIIFDHTNDGINNFTSIIGGKLTTYRHISEEVVDNLFKKLGYPVKQCRTISVPLIGNIDSDFERYKKTQSSKAQKKYELDVDIVSHLIALYGKRYKYLLEITKKDPDTGRLLSSNALDIRAQVYFSLDEELAYTVSDVYRRMSLGLRIGLGEDALSEVAKIVKGYYRLTENEINEQINDYYENVVNLRKVDV